MLFIFSLLQVVRISSVKANSAGAVLAERLRLEKLDLGNYV